MLLKRQVDRRSIGPRLAAVATLAVLMAGLPARGQELAPDLGLPGARGGRLDRFGDLLPAGAVARIGTVRLQHGCSVWSVTYSPDGKLLTSAGEDGTVRLWDAATGREDHRLAPMHGRVAFLPDGKSVIAAGEGHASVRDLATGKTLYTLPIEGQSLVLLGDGKTLAVPEEGGLQLWDLAARKPVRTVKHPGGTLLAFAPDGKQAAVGVGKSLHVIDLATGGDAEFMAAAEHGPHCVAYAPDGKSLAVCNNAGGVTVWDTATRKQRFQLCDDESSEGPSLVRFSPDGRKLLTAGRSTLLLIWEVSPRKKSRVCAPDQDVIYCADFSPDGKTVAVAGEYGRVQLLDADSGRLRMPFEQPPDVGSTAVFRADGKTILTSSADHDSVWGGSAAVWDAATGKDQIDFRCFSYVGHIQASADGSVLAVQEEAKDVLLFTAATGALRKLPERNGGQVHAVSGDGRRGATVVPDSHDVSVWDAATGKDLRRFASHARPSRLALSPDGTALVVASLKTVTRWGGNAQSYDDGDDTIRVLDVATGRERWKFADARSPDVAFSADGRWLAASGQQSVPGDEPRLSTEVRLWDAATGRQAWMADKHKQPVHAFAFSPDGRVLATGCEAGEVRLWEVASGQERLTFRAHRAGVTALSFAPDGRRLVTGGHDRTALVWDLADQAAPAGADPVAAWAALAEDDGRQAYAAVRQLAADPARAVPLLRARLRPAAAADGTRVAKRIADLDGDAFAVREAAQQELFDLGDAARPAVGRALAAGGSTERQRRLRLVLERMDGYSPEQLRAWRALEVLERIGTPDARQVLTAVAAGPPTARLTADAKAALQRLTARAAKP